MPHKAEAAAGIFLAVLSYLSGLSMQIFAWLAINEFIQSCLTSVFMGLMGYFGTVLAKNLHSYSSAYFNRGKND
jgi:hypothetical protein